MTPRVYADGIPVYCAYDELVDPAILVPNPRNPNRHSEEQIRLLAKLIRHHGWRVPITVSKRSGFVVRGHGRLQAAVALGVSQVPVDRQDYATEADEWADLIADNHIAELAETDMAALKDLLQELDTGAFDMELTGYTEDVLEELMTQVYVPEQEIVQDEVPELPEEPVTKPGDLWILGPHRVLCGDSTNPEHVARLFGGDKPFLMVTDPPCGVNYDPKWRDDAAKKGLIGFGAKRLGEVTNDNQADWTNAYKLFLGDVAYVWHAGMLAGETAQSLHRAGFEIRAQIIWAKPSRVISRGHYNWQHEPCWYAVRKGRSARWCGDHSQSTIWEIRPVGMSGHHDEVDVGTPHGTPKPVECMARPIRNHGQAGDIVYDPFIGSGTTLIAAEQLGRVCYGMEIDPRYVDVIVQRWENLTGKRGVRA